jgi:hypothetical protein
MKEGITGLECPRNMGLEAATRRKEPIKVGVLRALYIEEGLPMCEIARLLCASRSRVYRSLKFHRIPRRPPGSGSVRIAEMLKSERAKEPQGRICKALRNDGKPCFNMAMRGRRYCWVHLNEVIGKG